MGGAVPYGRANAPPRHIIRAAEATNTLNTERIRETGPNGHRGAEG